MFSFEKKESSAESEHPHLHRVKPETTKENGAPGRARRYWQGQSGLTLERVIPSGIDTGCLEEFADAMDLVLGQAVLGVMEIHRMPIERDRKLGATALVQFRAQIAEHVFNIRRCQIGRFGMREKSVQDLAEIGRAHV